MKIRCVDNVTPCCRKDQESYVNDNIHFPLIMFTKTLREFLVNHLEHTVSKEKEKKYYIYTVLCKKGTHKFLTSVHKRKHDQVFFSMSWNRKRKTFQNLVALAIRNNASVSHAEHQGLSTLFAQQLSFRMNKEVSCISFFPSSNIHKDICLNFPSIYGILKSPHTRTIYILKVTCLERPPKNNVFLKKPAAIKPLNMRNLTSRVITRYSAFMY